MEFQAGGHAGDRNASRVLAVGVTDQFARGALLGVADEIAHQGATTDVTRSWCRCVGGNGIQAAQQPRNQGRRSIAGHRHAQGIDVFGEG